MELASGCRQDLLSGPAFPLQLLEAEVPGRLLGAGGRRLARLRAEGTLAEAVTQALIGALRAQSLGVQSLGVVDRQAGGLLRGSGGVQGLGALISAQCRQS